ncbi:tetraacyldisaccharide 4'-kinase [Massilia sp. TS11]|uniref:tetraacyldisaccharide 4'-kinase n=1 Tax=Massilia sp. TS11 TaxID=2908003 RepID=UPI001EDC3533|nr:tetraacyldisaccharide 4'-kinase [Massilia sp. TS11]MCG2585548.1 tetraacyldisaccharide 4'-kinase [Massilia sp. TS11]
MAAHDFLMRNWQRRGPLARALWPLAQLFGALAAARRARYADGRLAVTRLPVPVIVVGNVFVGGTGKTPFTIWLVQQLRALGARPGVVSRGFGRRAGAPCLVGPDASAAAVGDEPLLIARHGACPVMVGQQRAAAAQALLAAHPELDLIVADDGLQHYALARDAEIVLFDARGGGNGWLLPAGPLREPLQRRRDFTVINGASLDAAALAALGADPVRSYRMDLVGEGAWRLGAPAERQPLAAFAGRRILAAAGIGDPARFFAMLGAAGLRAETLALPDHFDYAHNPFAASAAEIILITEKDAVKCAQLEAFRSDPRLWVVPVTARLDPALAAHILETCRGRPSA